MRRLPAALAIALWLTGSMWLVGIGFYYFELPAPMLAGVFIMGLVVALMEWRASQRQQKAVADSERAGSTDEDKK